MVVMCGGCRREEIIPIKLKRIESADDKSCFVRSIVPAVKTQNTPFLTVASLI